MFSFIVFCGVWFLLTVQICRGNSIAVIRFSIPEDHTVCLPCAGSDGSDVIWTHRDQKVGHGTDADSRRYRLQPDGGLCLQRLDDSDSGMFSCNRQPVAELQVLTGHDFTVSAGRTLLLPCGRSPKPKKKWSQRRAGGRWENVLTWFRNGTVKPERGRLSIGNEALQIQNLKPEDAGEYKCNGESRGRLTVLTGRPEPTTIQRTTSTTLTAVVVETEEVDGKEEKKKRPENAVLLVSVVGSALMVFLLAAVCVLLTSVKCSSKKYRPAAERREDTELQPWTTSTAPPGNTVTPLAERRVHESPTLPEEAIHYASLGRQNWRERPSRTPPDQNQDQDQDQQHVIYSSVVTRPAAKQKRYV
ncbi:uncharacterized protein LOC117739230 [Cyclopterus lumpus]|uniref:uncharacterized protein LOC117739230 n=1 Tax=Cyclopterus lumpus TaxID=8103 RepID=UPI001486F7D6|nr:uncharacterized protein LOC117739230 [Cyclopterus lumpus]